MPLAAKDAIPDLGIARTLRRGYYKSSLGAKHLEKQLARHTAKVKAGQYSAGERSRVGDRPFDWKGRPDLETMRQQRNAAQKALRKNPSLAEGISLKGRPDLEAIVQKAKKQAPRRDSDEPKLHNPMLPSLRHAEKIREHRSDIATCRAVMDAAEKGIEAVVNEARGRSDADKYADLMTRLDLLCKRVDALCASKKARADDWSPEARKAALEARKKSAGEGGKAYASGQNTSHNPHKAGTAEHENWQTSWRARKAATDRKVFGRSVRSAQKAGKSIAAKERRWLRKQEQSQRKDDVEYNDAFGRHAGRYPGEAGYSHFTGQAPQKKWFEKNEASPKVEPKTWSKPHAQEMHGVNPRNDARRSA